MGGGGGVAGPGAYNICDYIFICVFGDLRFILYHIHMLCTPATRPSAASAASAL